MASKFLEMLSAIASPKQIYVNWVMKRRIQFVARTILRWRHKFREVILFHLVPIGDDENWDSPLSDRQPREIRGRQVDVLLVPRLYDKVGRFRHVWAKKVKNELIMEHQT